MLIDSTSFDKLNLLVRVCETFEIPVWAANSTGCDLSCRQPLKVTYKLNATIKAPAAIGPYSQGIAAGSFVFVSGQLPICAATGEMPEDIKAQAEMSLLNVKAVLEAAGSSLDKVVKTTCFLADINDFAAFNEVYACMMPKTGAPSRSAVGIAALPKGAKVEIEAIAIR